MSSRAAYDEVWLLWRGDAYQLWQHGKRRTTDFSLATVGVTRLGTTMARVVLYSVPSHRHQAEGPQEIVTAIEVRRGNRQLCAPGPNCDVVKLAIASMPDVVDTTGVGWRHRRLSTRRRALDKLARHDAEDPTGRAARRHHRLQDGHRLRHHARPILHDCGQIVSAP